MAKSQETYSKKEKEKKKIAQRKEKEEKKQERKANAVKGGLDTMMAYVDENGNITDSPPDPTKKLIFNVEDMQLGATKIETVVEEPNRTGTVTFFNDAKGFGFIKDAVNQESLFVHANQLNEQIKENDKVSFNTERGQKGMVAINVSKIKP
jgi:cold shock CspA family protein